MGLCGECRKVNYSHKQRNVVSLSLYPAIVSYQKSLWRVRSNPIFGATPGVSCRFSYTLHQPLSAPARPGWPRCSAGQMKLRGAAGTMGCLGSGWKKPPGWVLADVTFSANPGGDWLPTRGEHQGILPRI